MAGPGQEQAAPGIGSGPVKLTRLNLELSSACNLNCYRCFRKTYIGGGKDKFLSPALLEKILPELKDLSSIDLTGWGEPLLHPEFGLILKRIRQNFSGSLSFTTNGLLLDKLKIEQALEYGVDIVCFSADAGGEAAYRQARGKHWEELEQAITRLAVRRKLRGSRKPQIYASFLLGRSRLPELFAFAAAMKELGVDGIILQQMTGVFALEDLKEVTYSGYYGTEFNEAELWDRVAELAKRLHGRLDLIPPERISSELQGGCGAFAPGHLFIKAIGEATPCCALGYPVLFINRKKELRRPALAVFGNILDHSLRQIWESPAAQAFRAEMQSRGGTEACGDCIGLYLRRAE